MNWDNQRDQALFSIEEWLKSDQQVFRLFGYAGTGKTTLAKNFAEYVSGTVLYCAFTGKASHVMRTKGCDNATTFHSLAYHSKDAARTILKNLEAELGELLSELNHDLENDTQAERERYIDEHVGVRNLRAKIKVEHKNIGEPSFTLNHDSEIKAAELLVIDEGSMFDGKMGEDALSFGTKILVLGDPAQLPPVKGHGFFTGVEPDYMLTEIHRQAKDNPIIAMATKVRNQEPLQLGTYGESSFVLGRDIGPQDAIDADQILVGRNKTRRGSNVRMRALLGHGDKILVPDDRLVCLRNNHEKGLFNGSLWNCEDIGEMGDERVYMTISPEDEGVGDAEQVVEAHTHYFRGNEQDLGWWERKDAEEFDYGYALTVHKSQGSQWDNTLLFDESYCFRKDRWKWLYTGITRAAEKVKVVDM